MASPNQIEPRLIFGDVSQGVMNSISHRVVPKNSVANAVNVDFQHVYGEASVRKGSTRVGSAAVSGTNDVDGLFQFVDSEAGAYSQLIAAVNGTFYYLSGSTWTASSGTYTSGTKTRFATFLDLVVAVNGTDAPRAWSGTGSWETSGTSLDLGNMPQGKLVTVYKDQVITAGVSGAPDTLYISSIPTAGTLSWTSGNRSITVNPDDGGNITGLGQISGQLIVFKDDGMFRWNNRATEPDRLIDVGCSSQESISSGGNMLFFFNAQGVWTTQGSYPVLISRRVQDWIDGMSAANYSSVAGWCTNRFYYCSIGDCTVDGEAFTNIVLRYTIDTKEWSVFSYPETPTTITQYKVSGDVRTVYGDASSNVIQIESSATDDYGSPIAWRLESQEQDMGSRARMKELRDRIVGHGTNMVDMHVAVQSEGEKWHDIGTLNGGIDDMRFGVVRGRFFKFRVTGAARTAQRFDGLEIPTISVNAYGTR